MSVALVSTVAAAQGVPLPGAARWADSARVLIEQGVMAHDSTLLVRAGAVLDKAMTAFPDDALLLHYRGYGLYREAMFAGGAEMADGTKRALERAIELLRRSAQAKPLAETHALLGSCMGSLAGTGITGGMKWGSAAGEATEAARTMAPNNPRVLLLEGIGKWFTPAMWGGGKDKGYALVQRAVAAYGQDTPARPLPAWGRAEAYAWLGQMEQERGRIAEARAAYERALAIEPGYGWVRNELLPRLAAR
ncbi:MAG: hypothetical protein MUE41_04710 [Gemmatimonadaceae bacterium]|nr:hypothetical protein [Gemmatimonadaceae bacterium]